MRDVRVDYHRPGKPSRTYYERLLVSRPEAEILLMDGAEAEVRVKNRIVLERGAPVVWFVFPGRWCDVARFHLADRSFTGWYTNLCVPVVTTGDHWMITDLFLDLWIPAQGEPEWLDEEEFETAVASGILTSRLAAAARAERHRLEGLLGANAWPPPVCKQTDLKGLEMLS
jgi:predicted RNA-binding protein associated with RNAse of E/G family